MVERIRALIYSVLTTPATDLARLVTHPRSSGQGLAEYALILAFIAILAIGALLFLSGALNGILSKVGHSV